MPDTASASANASCPTPRQLELLTQWNDLQSGFQRLTDQVLGDVEARTGLAPSSFQALFFLLTSPGCAAPMGQLASTLGFTTAGTTGLADRLACVGLLERRPDQGDRRVILAALTGEGQRVACAAARMLADTLQELPLGPDGLAGLIATLGSLAPRR